jgi:AcrR family transcriptional regulator
MYICQVIVLSSSAGVSPSALYLHVADKDALLRAVMIATYVQLHIETHADRA